MIAFEKWHGLGNDFVIMEAITNPILLNAQQVRQWADRHRGIGFDQLLLLENPRKEGCDFHYRVFNADGGEVAQCGNGARCVAQFLRKNHFLKKETLRLSTRDSELSLKLIDDIQVCVNFGEPQFIPEKIPFRQTTEALQYTLRKENQSVTFSVAHVGNPHAIIVVDAVDLAPVEEWGTWLAQHPDFPLGVNVGFLQTLSPEKITLRVYERGVGETLACGSGALAAALVGRRLLGLAPHVAVELLGGTLWVEWQGLGYPAYLTGPTAFVYQGQIVS